MAKAPNVKFKNCQFIVSKFLKPNNINWSREIKIARQLIEQYSEIQFWELLDLGFKLNSLAWLLTPAGQKVLKLAEASNKLVMPERQIFEETQGHTVEIPKIVSKPKSIKDFLK